MILNLLIIIKTILYIILTEVKVNRILVLLITSLITITILEFIKNRKFKGKNILRLLIYSIISIIMFADVVYYIQFNTLPSVSLLKQLGLLSAVGDSVLDLLNFKNLLLILDIPILIIISVFRKNKKKRDNIFSRKKRPNYSLYTLGALVVVMVFSIFTGKMESLKSQEIFIYHITDLKDNLIKDKNITHAGEFGEEDLNELKDRTKLKDGKLTGLGKDKNLLVIQVEALQNFAIGMEYEGQEVTPELNKLIEDRSSVYYDNYYQLVGRGNTSDAEFVSHNSVHPSMEEPSYTRFGTDTFYGLPNLLKDNGYRTVAMHGHDGEYWNRREAYKSQGFDEFLDIGFYEDYEELGLGVSDKDFYIQSIDHMKEYKENNNNPFYGFLVTLSSHTPFNMPEKYMELDILPEHEDTMLGRYINSIHYADKQIGFMLDYLKKTGLYDDTVIALYGDHFAVSSAKEEEAEVMTEYFGVEYDFDHMMNIPLIIHIPNEDINETISNVGSQLDFFPTILNVMGYENQKGLMFGRDITNYEGYNFVNPQTYMAKGSFIDNEHVFVISRDGIFENSRAYDIRTREELDIEQFRDKYNEAINEINLSDYILNNGILEEYILNGGKLNLSNMEKEIDIEKIHRLTLSNLDEIKEGILDIDVKLINDRFKIVNEELEEELYLDEIIHIMENEDLRLLIGTEENEVEVLKIVHEKFGNNNIMARIKDYESYIGLTNNMYKDVLLDPRINGYKKKEIEDFISRNPNLGIIKPKDFKDKDLESLGTNIYEYVD